MGVKKPWKVVEEAQDGSFKINKDPVGQNTMQRAYSSLASTKEYRNMARRGSQLSPHELRKSLIPKQDDDENTDDEYADDNYWDKQRVRVEKHVLKPAHE